MDGYVEKGNVSSGYVSTNSHTIYQHIGLKSYINYNDRDDMELNANLHNGDLSSAAGLLNSHTLPQFK